MGTDLLELPGGFINEDEVPLGAARRELTGYTCNDVEANNLLNGFAFNISCALGHSLMLRKRSEKIGWKFLILVVVIMVWMEVVVVVCLYMYYLQSSRTFRIGSKMTPLTAKHVV